MNTIEGGLSLDEALAQLREHYTRKLEHERPGSERIAGALEALASLEWHVKKGGGQ